GHTRCCERRRPRRTRPGPASTSESTTWAKQPGQDTALLPEFLRRAAVISVSLPERRRASHQPSRDQQRFDHVEALRSGHHRRAIAAGRASPGGATDLSPALKCWVSRKERLYLTPYAAAQ